MSESNRSFYKAYDAMVKPYDLGSEVMRASDIEVGKSYYFRDFSRPYTKARVTSVYPGAQDTEILVGVVFEDGSQQGIGIMPGNPRWMSKAYFVSPKPTQKAIGEIFVKKTPISSKPGVGPANIVRSFLNVQHTKKTRKHRKHRKTRRSKRN